MRFGGRLLGLLVLATVALLSRPTLAAAHSCAEPVTVVEGEETLVEVAVTVGELPTGDITFQFDGSIEVVEVPNVRGWEVERTTTTVRYLGGPLDPDTCVPFEMVIRAGAAGTSRVHVLQRLESGTVVEHPSEGDVFLQDGGASVVVNRQGPPNAAFEQVVHVTEGSGGSGARGPLLIGTAVGAVIAVLLVVTPSRRRRA